MHSERSLQNLASKLPFGVLRLYIDVGVPSCFHLASLSASIAFICAFICVHLRSSVVPVT